MLASTQPFLADDALAEHNSPTPTGVEVPVPSTSDNGRSTWFDDEQPNVLWRHYVIEAGTKVRTFKTRRALHVTLLYEPEPALLAIGLPFHGSGPTVSDAERDLLTAMEELFQSLSQRPESLSPYLRSVVAELQGLLERA